MPNSGDNLCPLCHGDGLAAYHSDKARDYLHCPVCDLVSVPRAQHLSDSEAKAYYDLHENLPDDPGYRRFLERLFTPLNQRLPAAAKGLDFGCGPGPTLSRMFAEASHEMALYDPLYAPDPSVLDARYDFITLSEVAEHLAEPGRELDQLWHSLTPGGWLGIMTKRVRDPGAFKTWHYITDPTHVSYFSEASFQWLAAHWSGTGPAATLTIAGNDVVLINKA